jgi:hypothetical protein
MPMIMGVCARAGQMGEKKRQKMRKQKPRVITPGLLALNQSVLHDTGCQLTFIVVATIARVKVFW